MKLIVTGATGLVGEGVLLECLGDPRVERVLSISRKPCGRTHPKLTELLVPDFRDLSTVSQQLTGFDGCLYCAGISSAGLSEAQYTEITYDTPLRFAQQLLALTPTMVFSHISGSHTDGTGAGKVMWARVKGRAENALLELPFKGVYHFRPGLMKPSPGQKNIKAGYRVVAALYPVMKLVFPGLTMAEVGRAMINSVESGAPRRVLEIADIRALAK
jgi:uncharacterized protein YbjT (DUF2867 family)